MSKENIATFARYNAKPIQKLDNNGDIIKEYASLKAASFYSKVSNVAISVAVKNGSKSAGYFWKYKSDNYNHVKKIHEQPNP